MEAILMPGELHSLSVAIGRLQEGLENLADQFQRHVEQTTIEQRKVHEIVDATSEAVRNVARDVTAMKPVVERYQKEAAEDRGEQRGERRIKGLLYSAFAVVGSLFTLALGKFIDWIAHHVPVIVIIVIALALMAGASAFGQEHIHPGKVITGDVGRFYGSWMRPDDRSQSCCNRIDCDSTDARMENGRWRAYSRLQNRWIDIPATRVEREREIPPGAHLCENSAGVICFGAGSGS